MATFIEEKPVDRPLAALAAGRASRAVEKLDAYLDRIRPTEAEAHPNSELGRAWDSLIGTVVKAGLRAEDVCEMSTPFHRRFGGVADTAPPPEGNGNGHPSPNGSRSKAIKALLAKADRLSGSTF